MDVLKKWLLFFQFFPLIFFLSFDFNSMELNWILMILLYRNQTKKKQRYCKFYCKQIDDEQSLVPILNWCIISSLWFDARNFVYRWLVKSINGFCLFSVSMKMLLQKSSLNADVCLFYSNHLPTLEISMRVFFIYF